MGGWEEEEREHGRASHWNRNPLLARITSGASPNRIYKHEREETSAGNTASWPRTERERERERGRERERQREREGEVGRSSEWESERGGWGGEKWLSR
jgi:hypothetical protein